MPLSIRYFSQAVSLCPENWTTPEQIIGQFLTSEDILHCGDYRRVVHGYRQHTGPSCLTWSALLVEDLPRRRKLQKVFNFLTSKTDSSYRKFVVLQSCGVRQPFAYEIFSAPDYHGINTYPLAHPVPHHCLVRKSDPGTIQ